MFCTNCGQQVDDNAVICPHCGVPIYGKSLSPQQKETNTLALIGFILSFVLAVPGLICSILGYKKAKVMGGEGNGLALAGIVISAVSIALTIIGILLWIGLFTSLLGIISTSGRI